MNTNAEVTIIHPTLQLHVKLIRSGSVQIGNLLKLFTIDQNTPEISIREEQVLCKLHATKNPPFMVEAKRAAIDDL